MAGQARRLEELHMVRNTLVFISGVAASATITSIVNAQDVSMTFSVVWDKPAINPGETNTGAVYAEIAPGIGSVVPWNTPPGKGQPGVIKRFATSIFDLLNLSNGQAGTLQWTVPVMLNIANIQGTPDGNGGVAGINVGNVGAIILPFPGLDDNPIKILDIAWTHDLTVPASEVTYSVKPASAKVFLDIGNGFPTLVGHNAKQTFVVPGTFQIPTASSASVVAMTLLLAFRRRR